MKRFAIAAACVCLSALAAPSFAVTPTSSIAQGGAIAEAQPQIAVDPNSLSVIVDRNALAGARTGQAVVVEIAGVGQFAYVVDQIIVSPEVLEISGHLRGGGDETIFLGLGPDGLAGLIKTGERTYALGYANKVQYFGEAGSKWMAKELASQSPALEIVTIPIGARPPVKGAEAAIINLPALTAMQPGDTAVMQLPGLGYTRVAFDAVRPGDGSATWVGHLKDFGASYKAILTYSPSGTEGTVLTPDGEINVTTGPDGQQYMFNPTALGLKNGMSAGGNCAATDNHGLREMFAAQAQASATPTTTPSGSPTVANASTSPNVIDVLVYYTPGMVTAYGSVAGVTTRIDSLIALANQAYLAGKLPYQIRRVGLDLLNTADTTSNTDLLKQMQARTAPFTGLDARRAQLGADLVSIVRPFYASAQGGSCGVAYVLGASGTSIPQWTNYAVSVVSDGADHAGLNYYCDNISFAHELGHNMGLMHDRATVTQQGGGTGAKPYAFGYVPSSAKWGTIMSYTFPHMINFSSPADATCNGSEVCGVSQTAVNSADNVSTLAYSMPLVAALMPSAAAASSYTVTGVVTVNGSAVAGATIAVANVTGGAASNVACTVSGSNGVYSCTAPANYGFQLTPGYKTANGVPVSWTPASASFTALAANQVANFAGFSADFRYTLSGTVSVNGVAAGGVVMAVSGIDAAKVLCSTTSSVGAYSCAATPGASFTVTPSMSVASGSTLTWTPPNASVAKMASNNVASFAGTLTLPKFVLSGTVKVNGAATSGVAMALSGTDAGKVSCSVTSSTGAYSCSAPQGSSFTVTPSMAVPTGSTLVWSPVSASVAKMSANASASFAGTLTVSKYTLSGTVTVNGVPSANVALMVSGADAAKVACSASGSTGAYSCTAPSGSSFTIAPSMAVPSGSTLTWAPASVTVTKMTGNATISFAGSLAAPLRTLTIAMSVNGTRTVSIPLSLYVTGAVTQVSCVATVDITIKCRMPANFGVVVTPIVTGTGIVFTPTSQTLQSMASDTTVTFVGKK